PDATKTAWDALGKARALIAGPGAWGDDEKALVAALDKRYHEPKKDQVPEDPSVRGPLDEAYAAAMRDLAKARPADADVVALAAEALMDLHPWDFWKADGSPQAWTPEILALLEKAVALDREHPGALHFTIHAVEASLSPEKGL